MSLKLLFFENCGKSARKSIPLTYNFMFLAFKALKFPMQNLLLQQLFIGGAHVEQCSMFVQELLLQNKNRATSDAIGQFYSWQVAFTRDSQKVRGHSIALPSFECL